MARKKTRRRNSRKKNTTRNVVLLIAGLAAIIGMLTLAVFEAMPGYPESAERFIDMLKGKPYSHSEYNGIDVSKHQGIIEWNEVAKDKKIQFVYIRAVMGNGPVDKRYSRNISEARKAGLKVGSYQFMTSKYSVDEQFRTFRSIVDPAQQDLIPMLDVEEGYFDKWTKEQIQDSLAKFSDLVKEAYGRKPMIYSSEHFYNQFLAPRFNDHIIYIASYSRYEPHIRGSHDHNLWQYSAKGHIRGIGYYVDLCRFTNGTTIYDLMIR